MGVGVWGPGLTDFASLCDRAAGVEAEDMAFVAPKPEAIPARERRRAGLMINLAVTVAHQACEHARVDKQTLPSVFVSAMGDTDITDYMCRKLAMPDKLLSPTKFHNSVHNAPSGYWSISAGNHAPSTFVGGYTESFAAGLLEAASQAQAAGTPVLLVAYDIANAPPFSEVTPVAHSFACALVVAPVEMAASVRMPDNTCLSTAQRLLNVQTEITMIGASSPAPMPQATPLAQLARANPMAVSLALLEQVVLLHEGSIAQAHLRLPAAAHLSLDLSLSGAA